MMCGCYFCIYNEKNECMLDEIELDSVGMCTECIFPNIKEEYLEFAKTQLRKKYEQEDGGM